MDNPEKIKAILTILNGVGKSGPWQPVDGHHTILALKEDHINGITVNLNQGVTVKLFINTDTGEVKTFLEAATK
jgi:hypothetical protein